MDNPEFRKPIFWFLWPDNSNDSDQQIRFIRVVQRGIIRLTLLTMLTLALIAISAITLDYLLTVRSLLSSLLLSAFIATLAVLTFRSWMLGTFVNDFGVKIVKIFSTRGFRWDVIDSLEPGPVEWRLGPIRIGIHTACVVVVLNDARRYRTHIYLGSVDGIFSQEKFDTAFSLMRRWFLSE
jgi:hypothetical protein